LILFYGSTGELYTYDLAFSAVAMLAVTSVKREHLKWVWLAFGIAGGFRFSSIVFLYPAMLAATVLRKEKLRSLIIDHVIGAVGISIWFVPFVIHHGGLKALEPLTRDTAQLRSTVLQSAATYASAAIWMLHLATPLLFLAGRQLKRLTREQKIILAVWLVLPTLFFVFKFYAKGYILITLPVIAILIGLVIDSFKDQTRKVATASITLGGLALFFFVPLVPPSIPLEQSSAIGDRVKTAGLRTLSWFATSNAHLRAREEMMQEAKTLLESHVPKDGVVLADGSMPVWAHPRTLQFHVPDRLILMTEGDEIAKLYAYDMHREFKARDVLPDTSFFICPTELADLKPAIRAMQLVERKNKLSLYRGLRDQLLAYLATRE
jgi:hypothetical protein